MNIHRHVVPALALEAADRAGAIAASLPATVVIQLVDLAKAQAFEISGAEGVEPLTLSMPTVIQRESLLRRTEP